MINLAYFSRRNPATGQQLQATSDVVKSLFLPFVCLSIAPSPDVASCRGLSPGDFGIPEVRYEQRGANNLMVGYLIGLIRQEASSRYTRTSGTQLRLVSIIEVLLVSPTFQGWHRMQLRVIHGCVEADYLDYCRPSSCPGLLF